jgi:hypothetical protein
MWIRSCALHSDAFSETVAGIYSGAIRKTHRVLFADAEISLASRQPVERSIRL